MTNKVSANNPFDLVNYKRQITMHKENTALKTSYQQTAVVNRERAKGIEPSAPYSKKAPVTEPKKFVADMPVMKKYVRPSRRKKMKDTPAFPHTVEHLHEPVTTGMTLRDYFAAKAMQGFIASPRGTPDGSNATDIYYARVSYLMADAMLKARE